jgi:hypothetical protein
VIDSSVVGCTRAGMKSPRWKLTAGFTIEARMMRR